MTGVQTCALPISISASRGNIYDRNGNVMAMSATVYKLILSPRDLVNSVDKKDAEGKDLSEEVRQANMALRQDQMVAELTALFPELDREKVEKQVAVKGARKAAGAGATGASGADVEIQVNEGVEEEAPKLKPQPKFSMFAKLGRKKDKGAEEVAEPVEMATEAAGAAVAVGNSERALVAMTDVNWKLPPVSLLEKKQAAADSGDVQQTAKIKIGRAHV